MELEFSLAKAFQEDTPEKNPTPARTEEQSPKRVLGFEAMVKEGDLVGFDEIKLVISEISDEIHEKASSIFEFSLQLEEMDENLNKRAMEVDLKENSIKEQSLELEKKEERLKELEKSITLSLEEVEKENDVKQSLESSFMRLVLEKQEEEVMEKLEEMEKKVELVSKFDKRVKEFDLKQKVSIDRRNKEAEVVNLSPKKLETKEKELSLLEEAVRERVAEFEKKKEIFEEEKKFLELKEKKLKQLEAKEKEVSLLDEAVKEKFSELERKKEIFEKDQKEKADEIEEKRKYLESKEKKVEEMVKELKLKQGEVQGPLQQAEAFKRSRVKMLAGEADSLLPHAKKHKSKSHDDEDKGNELACVVSASASSFEHLNQAQEEENDDVVSLADTDTDEDPEEISCVDSEFHDFETTLSSSMVGKVWALYDPLDEMPRLYGRIKKIIKSRLSVHVTRLCPKDEEESVPVACGWFEYGQTETMSYLTLSHEVNRIVQFKNIAVNPRKGETWALFRGWSKNPEQHKPPYRYDFVEVISFDDQYGFGVVYLGKVEGFVSVFKHQVQHGVVSRVISLEEMGRFSHRVPSVRLSGEEKEGVPAGSFELDPAAVPNSILKLDHSVREEANQDGSREDIPIILD